MRYSLVLAASILANPFIRMEADKGGASAGTAAKSPADELKDLRTEKDQLTRDIATHKATIDTLNADLSKARDAAKTHASDLKAATDKSAKLETDLATANTTIADLKKEAKTADEKATEKAAAAGVIPSTKDAAAISAGSKDLKALNDEYQKLTGRARSVFFKKHESDLMAYADQLAKDAKQAA